MRDYIPPTVISGSILELGNEGLLAPGVRGYAINMRDGRIFIPLIIADTPGLGDVRRFLASLDSRCCVTNVLNGKLRGMLIRMGFIRSEEEGGEVWQRPAQF